MEVPIDGLRSEEAGKRLAKYGRNELVEKGKRSLLAKFLDQFRDFMILVLMAAAVVSGFVGELADTVAILVIVILNAVIGFVQEYRAEKAMEALKQMAAPDSRVLRDGNVSSVAGSEIVPGDLVLLEAGGIVPADMRLTEVARLKIEEAALTGESVPVEKHTRALPEEMLSLGDRSNMAFKGTVVTYGRGTGVVVGTGMDTELGKIASMLQEEVEGKTPSRGASSFSARSLPWPFFSSAPSSSAWGSCGARPPCSCSSRPLRLLLPPFRRPCPPSSPSRSPWGRARWSSTMP